LKEKEIRKEREIRESDREIGSEKEIRGGSNDNERRTTTRLMRGDERKEVRSFFLFLPFYSTNRRPVSAQFSTDSIVTRS